VSGTRYLTQLMNRWGKRGPSQFYKMFKLHRTSFEQILENMFEVLEEFQGKFAFPTIASIARTKPELIKEIEHEGHEVASHGFNHVRYPTISNSERKQDLKLSLQIFRNIGIDIKGFRAPYDNYTDDMVELLDEMKLVWDGGFGYRKEYRDRNSFFTIDVNGKPSSTTFIPLNELSDDRMIDSMGMSPSDVSKALMAQIEKRAKVGGVIMFDLHPIRIGQQKYVNCLRDVLELTNQLNGWSATPTEAVTYWNKHRSWKGNAEFCLLLTGDIDNWGFSDYLRRILLKRYMRNIG
jgi:peptidoglycan/xylan/chitin deacetylase (PgdA/CDA1 family)